MSIHAAIRNAAISGAPIPQTQVLDWIAQGDLRAWGLLYHLTRDAHDRIEPPLEMQDVCSFLLDYYLRCVIESPPDDTVHSRFEAARELVGWLDHLWAKRPQTQPVVALLVDRVTSTFRDGDQAVRNALETGFLEHAFEREHFVPLFQHWRLDPVLKDAYQNALQWGVAHR